MYSLIILSSNCRLLVASVLLTAVFYAGCASLDPGGPSARSLIIKKTALYEEGGGARRDIKEKCELEERLPSLIRKFAERHYDTIYLMDKVPPATPAKVLTLKITGFSPEKSKGTLFGQNILTVEGILTQDGAVVGSFTDTPVISKRPKATDNRGTCYLLNRSAKRVGKDIGSWLAKPSMNATLGGTRRPRQQTVPAGAPEAASDADDQEEDEE